MKRLVGEDVEVLTGGPTNVVVCYCENLSLDTRGASVHIGHMNCTGSSVVVQSHGGQLDVGGIDGVGSLLSQGGPVSVQVGSYALWPSFLHF